MPSNPEHVDRRHRVVVVGGGFGGLVATKFLRKGDVDDHGSSTARTTTSSSRCSTRSRRASSRRARSHRRSGESSASTRTSTSISPRSPASISRTEQSPPSGRWEHRARSPTTRLIVAAGVDDVVLRTRRTRPALAPDEDDRRRPQPATADLRGVRAGRDRRPPRPSGGGGSPSPSSVAARPAARSRDRSPSSRTGRSSKDFRAIDPASAVVLLVEADTQILGAFGDRLSQKATDGLERMGSRSAPTRL